MNNAAGEAIVRLDWGIKNYVEAALYLGILPLALAVYALVPRRNSDPAKRAPMELPPPSLTASSIHFRFARCRQLTFMFGLPTYAVIYGLPGVNQLDSPFRWIFALTLCVAVLAGFGLELR